MVNLAGKLVKLVKYEMKKNNKDENNMYNGIIT